MSTLGAKSVSGSHLSQGMISRSIQVLWWVVRLALWPWVTGAKFVDRHFISYLTGRIVRDQDRIYSIKFIWYADSVYLHPMIWGSLLLFVLAQTSLVSPGWLLLFWFLGLVLCYVTIMYNMDVVKSAVLATAIVALLGAAYFSTVELAWNPLLAIRRHIVGLRAVVTPGFYVASAYVFSALIAYELIWAWLFRRVEIDESYVYEHQFLRGTTREPIFAQSLKRETKDLLELLILGAADIQHRTKKGVKRFRNVPFASLWLGTAIDSLLDHRRKGQIVLERAERERAAEQARIADALHEDDDDDDGGWDEETDGEADGDAVATESDATDDAELA